MEGFAIMPSSTSTRSPTPDTSADNFPTPQPNRYTCPDCDRSYKAVETLNRHRKNHSSSIRYSCSSCTASFKRKDLLDRHVQIHEGGRGAVLSSTRGVRACERCSRLKTKCDRVDGGSCSRCVKGGHVCSCRERRGRGRWGKDAGAVRSLQPCETHPEAAVGGEFMTIAEDQGRGDARAFSNPGDFARSCTGSWSSEGGFWDQGHSWQWPDVLDSQLEAVQDVLPDLSVYGESPAGFDATWPETFDPALALELPPPEKFNPAGLDYNADCCNDMSWCDCPPALTLPEAALWTPDCLSGDMAALTMLFPQTMYPIRSSIW